MDTVPRWSEAYRASRMALSGVGLAAALAAWPASAQQVDRWRVVPDTTAWTQAVNSVPWARPQVRQLPTGEVLVLDPPARELWLLSAGSRELTKLARPGRGPGEISESMSFLSVLGDSVVVLERGFGPGRASMFTRQGRFLRSTTIAATTGGPGSLVPLGVLGSDRFLVSRGGFRPFQPKADERFRIPVSIGTWTQASATYQPVAVLPGTTFIGYRTATADGASVATVTASLAPASAYIARSDAVVIGDASWDSLVVVHPETGSRRTIRLPWQQAPIDAVRLRRSREASLAIAHTRDDSASVVAVHSPPAVPSAEPLFSSLLLGPQDELWVERFRYPGSTDSRFTVLSIRTGQVLGDVLLPPGFRAQQIGEAYLVGTQTLPSGEVVIARLILNRTGR
jgi:hypothetical protein